MNTGPFDRTISLLSVLILLVGCQDKKSDQTVTVSESETSEQNTITYKAGAYFFGQIEPSPLESGKFNIELVQFEIDTSDWVNGTFYYEPYGTDGMRGSFTGRVDREAKQLMCKRVYYAEGDRYKEAISFPLLKDSLGLGYTNTGEVAGRLPRLDNKTYQNYKKTLEQQMLTGRLNTSDRSRLKQLPSLKSIGFSEDEIAKMKFMEVMVDLDNDPSELEYLIYVMDPMLCGTGGCNLLLTTSNGELISELTVTRPPIYMEVNTIEESNSHKGQWKPFYVYSDGMRRVSPVDGKYPKNPSLLPEIRESELTAFPEQYRLVMDYLDE
jgi:hypothetical protein